MRESKELKSIIQAVIVWIITIFGYFSLWLLLAMATYFLLNNSFETYFRVLISITAASLFLGIFHFLKKVWR